MVASRARIAATRRVAGWLRLQARPETESRVHWVARGVGRRVRDAGPELATSMHAAFPRGAGEPLAHWATRCIRIRMIESLPADPLTDTGGATEVDVLMPVGPNDLEVSRWALDGLRRNLRNDVKRVLVVAPHDVARRLQVLEPGVDVVSEEDVLTAATRSHLEQRVGDRAGWLTQQLIKLSAPQLTDASAVLVMDADTIMVRPRLFRHDDTTLMLAAREFHTPYQDAISRLLKRPFPFPQFSCVTHHMCFMRDDVLALQHEIEHVNAEEWQRAIIDVSDPTHESFFADYEIFGQWRLSKKPSACVVRGARNLSLNRSSIASVEELHKQVPRHIYSVSCHWYL